MEEQTNILSHVITNENATTQLLYALCAYRPFREVLVRLCTQGQFGVEAVQWGDLNPQMDIGGAVPDLVMEGQSVTIVLEVKITAWRSLTSNQPEAYLTWLASHSSTAPAFFVALIPRGTLHLDLLQSRIASFQTRHTQQPVTTAVIQWDEFHQGLVHHDLDRMNASVRDFCQILKSWDDAPLLSCRFEEVRAMYDAHTATGNTAKVTLCL